MSLYVGEDGFEVCLIGLELLLRYHRACSAELVERLYEESAQSGRIVVTQLGNDSGSLGSVLNSLVGHDSALEGIKEADAEIVIVSIRDLGVGAGSTHRRNLSILKCRSCCD